MNGDTSIAQSHIEAATSDNGTGGSFISPASFWLPDTIGQSEWTVQAPFAFWLVDAIRPKTIVTQGVTTVDAHLTYCQAVERLSLKTQCLAFDEKAPGIGEADLTGTRQILSYHDLRYGRFSTILYAGQQGENVPVLQQEVDLLHLDDVLAIDEWLPRLSRRGVVVIHNLQACRENHESRARWASLTRSYGTLSLRAGRGLGIVGVGAATPTALDDLIRAPVAMRLLVDNLYARLGSEVAARCRAVEADTLRVALKSSETMRAVAEARVPAAQIEVDRAVAALSETRNELAFFKTLLHASAKREDDLHKENDRLREAEIQERSQAARSPSGGSASTTPARLGNVPSSSTPRYITELADLSVGEPPTIRASVSVVIPTYNAGAELYWLIRKLKRQRGIGSLEIVIVDSGSKDGSVALARKMDCRVVDIDNNLFSHSFARNLGADCATSDYILFMVQDAFPVGDWWINSLLKGLLTPLPDGDYIAALSCAEHPRRDSELAYNIAINTHYRFLGCFNADKVGQFTTSDNHALRTQGQLSDVTCLMSRNLFLKYRHHGRYAEDLLLGIRLIKDGYRVAMLSSVKVIHSHTRSQGYYVRRIFVDVTFLSEIFPDFGTPKVSCALAVYAAAACLAEVLPTLKASWNKTPWQALGEVVDLVRSAPLPPSFSHTVSTYDFQVPALATWIRRVADRVGSAPFSEEQRADADLLRGMFVGRLLHVQEYVKNTYRVLDRQTAFELHNTIAKTLGMSLGAGLAFFYLDATSDPARTTDSQVSELKPLLLAGI